MPKATSLARIVWRGCAFRKARTRVSEGTYTRFGRYEPAELVRKFVEVVSSVAEMVRRFMEVIRNFVEMVTGCTELVGRGAWLSVGCDGLVGRGVWVSMGCDAMVGRGVWLSVGCDGLGRLRCVGVLGVRWVGW